jgi:hypothetical protein
MNDFRPKLTKALRVIIGGPLGVLAWAVSGASAVAVVLWGIKAVAIPLLMLKTASWGIWGFGVFRESKAQIAIRKDLADTKPSESSDRDG